MSECVDCPYCHNENDISPDEYNEGVEVFERDCKNCGSEMKVTVDWLPSFSASKSSVKNQASEQ